jgi:mono/diheme cytochrome c family protein
MKTAIVICVMVFEALSVAPSWADDAAATKTPAATATKTPAEAATKTPAEGATETSAKKPPLNVPQLFATTCGWCHSDAGRAAGKGPQLMFTKRSDDFIRYRIKHGKEGHMPAFGAMFSDADIDRIIAYIRALRPD